MRGRQRFQPDVAARVVVHADQRAVDRGDPLPDQLGLLVQLRLEAGDVPDRVLVQVRLELPPEPGQVVAGEATVQLAVTVGGLDRVIELGRLDRVLPPELPHRRDDLVGQPAQPVAALRGQRAEFGSGRPSPPGRRPRRWPAAAAPLRPAPLRSPQTGPRRPRTILGENLGTSCSNALSGGVCRHQAAQPSIRARCAPSGQSIRCLDRIEAAVSRASSADADSSRRFSASELLGPVDHGLPVDLGELVGLVQPRRAHLAPLDRASRPSRAAVLSPDHVERALQHPGTVHQRVQLALVGPAEHIRLDGRRCGAGRPSRAARRCL